MVKTSYHVVLVTHSSNGKLSFKFKARGLTKPRALAHMAKCKSKIFGEARACCPDYRVVDDLGVAKLTKQVSTNQNKRREAGAVKAAATRAKRGPRKPSFICCPTCGAKSKKLYVEFGGLQTRQCQNNHLFEIDTFAGLNIKRRIQCADRGFFVGPQIRYGTAASSLPPGAKTTAI